MQMKSILRNTIVTLLLFPGLAMATSVKSEFQQCAAMAMKAPMNEAGKIQVDTSGMRNSAPSYPAHTRGVELGMILTNKTTGESFANVVCNMDSNGNITDITVEPLAVTEELAANID